MKLTSTQTTILEAASRGALSYCIATAYYLIGGDRAARFDIVNKLQDELLLDDTKITERGRLALLLSR